jgi:hypothetical protein
VAGVFAQQLPSRYAVTANYIGLENGKAYTTTHVIDVEGIKHRLVDQDDDLKAIKQALSDIAADFRDLKRETLYHYTAATYQQSILSDPIDGGRLLAALWRASSDMGPRAFIRQGPATCKFCARLLWLLWPIRGSPRSLKHKQRRFHACRRCSIRSTRR